jgi:hypothetical protein
MVKSGASLEKLGDSNPGVSVTMRVTYELIPQALVFLAFWRNIYDI